MTDPLIFIASKSSIVSRKLPNTAEVFVLLLLSSSPTGRYSFGYPFALPPKTWRVVGYATDMSTLGSDQLVAAMTNGEVASSPSVGVCATKPFSGKDGGWAKKIGTNLERLRGPLLRALVVAAQSLGATSWSLSELSLGMSVSLTWS